MSQRETEIFWQFGSKYESKYDETWPLDSCISGLHFPYDILRDFGVQWSEARTRSNKEEEDSTLGSPKLDFLDLGRPLQAQF